MSSFVPHSVTSDRLQRDPDTLPLRDRACLRVLARADALTAVHLAALVYRRRRTAQARLQWLWEAGLLERLAVPQARPGTSPYAYRLSRAARTRLGIEGRRKSGPTTIRHTLDGATFVCALVTAGRAHDQTPVQAWLPEPMLDALDLGHALEPDGIVVLQAGDRSAVLCLEIDEGTQHVGVIRPRLGAYSMALRTRPGWRLLVVVPSATRATWYTRLASRVPGWANGGPGLIVVLEAVVRDGLDAPVATLGGHRVGPLRSALPDLAGRSTEAPVGSAAWVELLGAGGGEQLTEALRP